MSIVFRRVKICNCCCVNLLIVVLILLSYVFFEKTLEFSYFCHIFDLYIQLYNPDKFPQWCNSGPPDNSEDTVWNSTPHNIQGHNPDKFPQWCDSGPPDSSEDT